MYVNTWGEFTREVKYIKDQLTSLNQWVDKHEEELKKADGVGDTASKMYYVVEDAIKLEKKLKAL